MKNQYSSIAQRYLANISKVTNKQKHKCYDCGLEFQTPMQLVNHSKNFCTNSGFDTLAGLNMKLKYPEKEKKKQRKINDSLTHALEEINKNQYYKPQQKQLRNDLLDYQSHKNDIQFKRPYLHRSKAQSSQFRKTKSLYMNPNENQYNTLQNKNSILNNKIQQNFPKSKAYSFTSSYIKKFKDPDDSYVSPPTQIPLLQNAKQFSLLDKSDTSIKNMRQDEKRQYVVRKILELQNIQEGYKKNGGKNIQFIANTKRMKAFYEQLLQDVNKHKQSKFGRISNQTRVSTPISKLQQLQNSKALIDSIVKDRQQSKIAKKLSQVHNKNAAKKQQIIRKRFKTQLPEQNELNMDILDQQIMKKNYGKRENPIIVIPINQPSSTQPQYSNNDIQFKHLQSLMQMRQRENKKMIQMMEKQNRQIKNIYQKELKTKQKQYKLNQKKVNRLQQKYNRLLQNQRRTKQQILKNQYAKDNYLNQKMNQKIKYKTEYNQVQQPEEQYREKHTELQNVRKLNLNSNGFYNEDNQLPYEDKILFQMQREQRDQLQLFSHLPKQIQQIKLQSIKQMTQKRFQMEKQVIKQKIQKLKVQQDLKSFDFDRKLVNQELQNQKKKMQIHKLMKKKINQFAKNEFYQNLTSQSEDQDNDFEGQNRNQAEPNQNYNQTQPNNTEQRITGLTNQRPSQQRSSNSRNRLSK